LAVFSSQSGVDPVGSCVGQKGVRVQAVINELGGNEKVDIIQWSDEAKPFIMSALAPAKELEVILHDDKKQAEVLVPDDQLSLAIGRDGQNVRLAAKITGWKIDIRGKGIPATQGAQETQEEQATPLPEVTAASEVSQATQEDTEVKTEKVPEVEPDKLDAAQE
jgi:transcription termination/antitermination protein NusA